MDADLGGVEEKKFPMLIKRDSLEKEKDHIEGFKPEVACVTRAGEPARPSSTYPYVQRSFFSLTSVTTHGVRAGQQSAKNAIGFIEAIMIIGREEGVKGYWKGNLPQVIRIVPYSAVQLFAYEAYKAIILFWGEDGQLSVLGAGACAGMTSTLITYPLDVLRLRLAVEPGYRTMSQGSHCYGYLLSVGYH
ncbi:thylakoid ADP,ATP carrier protein, chloroplastic-like [Brassica napus]|uniref:thylakoid ADP,ATP carrier protein, chloroplastic-like n=1 Tax=Brassica napus TaxID=3708 RepID=UPI00207AB1EE|nr:thylakoid ADP,ATP carrier protein, chloroplastic-like [Brassica napus]